MQEARRCPLPASHVSVWPAVAWGSEGRTNTIDNGAIIAYQVELQERAGTALSTVLNYNTQHSQNEEYITVTLSDQGSTGAEGVSQIATTRIPITIIAVNDDPIITSAELEYAISEDRPSELTGNVIADVDLGEKIVSSLADLEWLKASESAASSTQARVKGRCRCACWRRSTSSQLVRYPAGMC